MTQYVESLRYVFRNQKAKKIWVPYISKQSKDTIIIANNITSTNKKCAIIKIDKSPRSFRGIKTLPVDYYVNSNA